MCPLVKYKYVATEDTEITETNHCANQTVVLLVSS